MYGGVSYNFCILHSSGSDGYIDFVMNLYLLDTFASAALDTVVLPYTAVQQINRGNVPLRRLP
ncbi:YceK/YidQ family lipoprotein [Marinimicrobium sp. ABcell2]|uniref:YceK/YidQ family lipoprotein n=1 Tax=Marinimicrobium sp. ABcell2 TaxID=3069751 RepID=UPI00359C7458